MSEKADEKLDREKFREKLKQIQNYLKECLKNPDKYEIEILKSRKWIEINCYRLLITDPSYYIENEIDSVLWKDRFYKPIEVERTKLKDKLVSINESSIGPLAKCISEGIDFYTNLFQKLKTIPTIEENPADPTPFSKHTKILINYSIFIHLGDLYRYQTEYLNKEENVIPTQMFNKSEYFYKQAIALDPTNGLGHHQLAVLSYQKGVSLCVYRFCRSLSCQTPVTSAIKNVRVQFQLNEKELKLAQGTQGVQNKKELLNLFIMEFIELQKYLAENVRSTEQFVALLKNTIVHLSTLLKYDKVSTPLIFRITVISIFAATDGWRMNEESSQRQSTQLTRSCIFGWVLLFSLMSCIIKYTLIQLPQYKENQFTSRHIPSVFVFIEWLQLQNQDGYRPKYITSEMVFSSTSQSKSSKEILLFLQCEHHCWFEIVELLNRMPLTDRIITDNSPLLYEVELRGFLPMRGKFDHIPSSKQLCEGSEADKRYMISICLSINKIIMDPRCPITISRDNGNQFVTEPNANIPNILTFMSMEGDFSMSGTGSYLSTAEDDKPFYLMGSSLSFHSRQPSSSSFLSTSSLDLRSHSSSRSASNSSRLRRNSSQNLQHLVRNC